VTTAGVQSKIFDKCIYKLSPDQKLRPNKLNPLENSRKPLVGRLGELERKVLCYASTRAWSFTASNVVEYWGLKLYYNGKSTANKRVHDAIQRLVKRGLLRKIDRGWYELAVDISPDLLMCKEGSSVEDSVEESKENLGVPALFMGLSRSGRVGGRVVRFHVRGVGGYLGLYEWVLFTWFSLGVVVGGLEGVLVRELGASKYLVRSVRRRVRRLVVSSVRKVIAGGHGMYARRYEPLIPVRGGYVYEYGVDLVTDIELPRVFIKIYTSSVEYR